MSAAKARKTVRRRLATTNTATSRPQTLGPRRVMAGKPEPTPPPVPTRLRQRSQPDTTADTARPCTFKT